MKRITLSALAAALLLLPCLRSFADVALLDTEKNKLQLYGFFKLDAVYQDAGVNGLTIPRYAVAGDGNLYLSATHSRFGLKYAGTPLNNGMNLSAVLEWDFLDTTSPNQMKPRFRQGFFSLQKKGHALLFGQAWDLFSPLGPTTLMTNGYLWQTGNLGFRHAQVRYSYVPPRLDFAVSVNDPASSGGWSAKMPVLQGRLGLKLGASNKFQTRPLGHLRPGKRFSHATVTFQEQGQRLRHQPGLEPGHLQAPVAQGRIRHGRQPCLRLQPLGLVRRHRCSGIRGQESIGLLVGTAAGQGQMERLAGVRFRRPD